jgi:hypothetical protein
MINDRPLDAGPGLSKLAGSPPLGLAGKRIFVLVADVVLGLALIAMIVIAVVSVPSLVAPQGVLVVLAIWTAAISLMAMPALIVLYLSPPRVSLRERSALIASASWFGRSIWAGAVFAGSIVLGAVSGVVAARVSDSEQDLGVALGSVIAATTQIALWPTIGAVASVAFVVMGMRWVIDLSAISDEGGAHQIWGVLERRWLGAVDTSARRVKLTRGLSWLAASLVGRLGLILLLVTISLDVAITWWVVAHM